MSALVRPHALLLDFGGVLCSSVRNDDWLAEITDAVSVVLHRAGADAPARDVIARDLEVARIAESAWKTAASRTAAPAELGREQYWGEFVAADWSPSARAALLADSLALSQRLVECSSDYVVRPGVRALLEDAARRHILVAVVSNTRSGTAFRAIVHREGLEDLLALQVYSDEVGMRKPNPGMLRLAADGLGVSIAECWYCGDHYDRDVMCARRAGAGVAVLVHDRKTLTPRYAAQTEPDVEVSSPLELVALLESVQEDTALATEPPSAPHTRRAVRGRAAARPAALLLDHGGVITSSRPDPDARAAFAGRVVEFLERTGWSGFDATHVAQDLAQAARMHAALKEPAGDGPVPEVSHLEFWRDLVAARWPEQPRAAVSAQANALIYDYVWSRSERQLRPGMLELMARCAAESIPIGIVSNTLCGEVPRALSVGFGTAPYLGVQIYSDELGVRKPDPAAITAATTALGVDPAECWFVGDKPGRDILCAHRAGIGRAVLMSTGPGQEADHGAALVVTDATDLLAHLEKTW